MMTREMAPGGCRGSRVSRAAEERQMMGPTGWRWHGKSHLEDAKMNSGSVLSCQWVETKSARLLHVQLPTRSAYFRVLMVWWY